MPETSTLRKFDSYWAELLNRLLAFGQEEKNTRTGAVVRIARGSQFFMLDVSDAILPTPGWRKVRPRTAAAETAWNILGHDHITWLRKYTKIWDAFAEWVLCSNCRGKGHLADSTSRFEIPTCSVCNGAGKIGLLDFAYGYRWRHQFGRDQLRLAVNALTDNPSDRRIFISSWHPGVDGLGATGQKNVPCPVAFGLNIVGKELHMAVTIRSSDVFVGLPYDVMNYAMLLAILSGTLGVRLGTISFTLHNAHIYETHFAQAEEALKQTCSVVPRLYMLGTPLISVQARPDDYVKEYERRANEVVWPSYDPKPEVVL